MDRPGLAVVQRHAEDAVAAVRHELRRVREREGAAAVGQAEGDAVRLAEDLRDVALVRDLAPGLATVGRNRLADAAGRVLVAHEDEEAAVGQLHDRRLVRRRLVVGQGLRIERLALEDAAVTRRLAALPRLAVVVGVDDGGRELLRVVARVVHGDDQTALVGAARELQAGARRGAEERHPGLLDLRVQVDRLGPGGALVLGVDVDEVRRARGEQ